MKLKDDVILSGLDIKMRPVLVTADRIWTDLGQELCVTAGLDGTHSAGSLHYYGLAVDLRINYFSAEEAAVAANQLREKLGVSYDVILHSHHIHIEYDPR